MLADDVRLIQSTYPVRAGSADVGMFFGIYSRSAPVRLAPAWLDGREVIAVYEDPQAVKPSYLMWLEWTDGQISFIRDYKYVRFRNGPGGVKSPVSTSPSIGAPRLSITSVVVAGLLLPSVVGTQAATSCHQKKR